MARILVVEDDQGIRDLIALRLIGVGHSVVSIADGGQALDQVDRFGEPDVYVLDVGLPDIDGFRLLGRLREAGRDAPTLFLSADTNLSARQLGAAMGAQYLTKPFVGKALIDAVAVAVGG